MSRPFKFRVWSETLRQWMNHVAIIDCRGNVGSHFVEVTETQEVKHHVVDMAARQPVVEQFTGLLDKDGREIYEGDIVSVNINERDHVFRINAEVWWQDGSWRFGRLKEFVTGREYGHRWHELFHYMTPEETWVVGNIHENPELLNP